jgi:aryl-alcohol dehydrogenase-like predicted oxidoreductase
LRFTLAVPGVSTAIVGTKNPARWQENAQLLAAGPLDEDEFNEIRSRWEEVAPKTWIGQT